jgi:LysR family glycine cleavage system transcriptional activator
MLSVRAFEAAARHGSFARAGDELCVTAGAVGHQVRLLEEWLGVELFARHPRKVELTDAGRRYFLEVRTLLEELERASLAMRAATDAREVTVSAMPSFVTRWLMPRLGRFRERHPEIEVRLLASVPPVDFSRDRVDLAIRLGAGPYPGLHSEVLLPETFVVVGQPALCRGLRGAADVLRHTLLHDEYEPRIPEQVDWPRWCAARGVKATAHRLGQGLRFSHTYLTLDAASAGQGLAIASDVLAGDAIAAGILRAVPGTALPGPYRFHLLVPPLARARPQVTAFCEWLRQEAVQFRETAAVPPA